MPPAFQRFEFKQVLFVQSKDFPALPQGELTVQEQHNILPCLLTGH